MSPAEAELASAPPRAASPLGVEECGERLLCGWGRTAPTRARMLRPRTGEEVAHVLAATPATLAERSARIAPIGGAIARGAARSYGDAAQNGGGAVIDATALRGEIALLEGDRRHVRGGAAGSLSSDPPVQLAPTLVRVGAGATFAELLVWLAAQGLTLPVVPGTRHLTVGGAIASDVHGKNHTRDGSFARHVRSFTLCTPADGPLLVSAERHAELFHATLGGMGLTGVVVEATLCLAPLRNPCGVADIDRLDTLDRAIASIAGEQRHRYTIAWVDLLSEGAAFGRAVLTRSDEGPMNDAGGGSGGEPLGSSDIAAHARVGGVGGGPISLHPRLTVPRGFPGGLLRPAAVRAFNAMHWHAAPRRARGRTLSMSAQLFPLDALGEWSRLYGPAGMVQYQFALPRGEEETLLRVVHLLRARRLPMYLAVLKRFGPGARGPLSFPLEGLTLAIDLPAGAPGLHSALDAADELVAGAGGRVYLAKDARLRPAMLAAMYPRLEGFRELRGRVDPDGVLRSDMGRRLGLCG
ncbi:MAG TPA: FAD-binding oxidoreductase [Solirubrobacteraceae bacterium]|nr:FAD-binding oxidoreductase [Solirubrobacteraceae bacterium]